MSTLLCHIHPSLIFAGRICCCRGLTDVTRHNKLKLWVGDEKEVAVAGQG